MVHSFQPPSCVGDEFLVTDLNDLMALDLWTCLHSDYTERVDGNSSKWEAVCPYR